MFRGAHSVGVGSFVERDAVRKLASVEHCAAPALARRCGWMRNSGIFRVRARVTSWCALPVASPRRWGTRQARCRGGAGHSHRTRHSRRQQGVLGFRALRAWTVRPARGMSADAWGYLDAQIQRYPELRDGLSLNASTPCARTCNWPADMSSRQHGWPMEGPITDRSGPRPDPIADRRSSRCRGNRRPAMYRSGRHRS